VRLREETRRKYEHEVSLRTESVLHEAERAARDRGPKIQRNYGMAYCATVPCTIAMAKRCTRSTTAACLRRSIASNS